MNKQKNQIPRFFDKKMLELHELVTQDELHSAAKASFNSLDWLIKQKINRPLVSEGKTLESEIITPYLVECNHVVEEQLRKDASGYSKMRWLWYLVRLPRFVFEGEVITTYSYDLALAKVITGLAGKESSTKPISGKLLYYPVDNAIVRRTLKFCSGVRYFSTIQVFIRLAGKGVKFEFDRYSLPSPLVTPEQDMAVKLYDNRVANFGNPFNRLGTYVAAGKDKNEYSSSCLIAVNHINNPSWVPSVIGTKIEGRKQIEVFMNYLIHFISIDKLKTLLSDRRLSGMQWLKPEVGVLLQLLKLTITILPYLTNAFVTIPQYGYFLIWEKDLRKINTKVFTEVSKMLKAIIPNISFPSNSNEFFKALEKIRGLPWPLRCGPIIRRENNIVCVDLCSATALLNYLFEFPLVDGEKANARADHFEVAVQKAIDSTTWLPEGKLRNLIGRTLKCNNEALTDLDAIGEKNETLLLISCKSLIYTSMYDIGDYRLVRNSISTLESAVDHWEKIREFLKSNKKGNNYDFLKYNQIIAVVCTPHPVYVPIGRATKEIAPGLMSVVCLSELISWLDETNEIINAS